jgi:hypothetical protein
MPLHWWSFRQWVMMMNPGSTTGISVLLTALGKLGKGVFSGCFEPFRHPAYVDFSLAKFSDDRHKRQFTSPPPPRSLVVMLRSPRIRALTLSLFSVVVAGPVTSVFTALKTTDPASDLTSVASPRYTLLGRLWIAIGLKPCPAGNSVTALCIVRSPVTSNIVDWYCFERTRLTRAQMMVAELDSVAIWCVRQETLPSATFLKQRKHYIVTDLRGFQRCERTGRLLLRGKSYTTDDNRHFALSLQWERQMLQDLCLGLFNSDLQN